METYQGDFLPKELVMESSLKQAKEKLNQGLPPEVAAIGRALINDKTLDDPAKIEQRAQELAERLEKSARRFDRSPTSGYFAGYETKDRTFDPGIVRIQQWAKGVKYDNLDARSDASEDEIVDYARGYLGKTLSGEEISRSLGDMVQLVGFLEDKAPDQVVGEYVEAFNASAKRLEPDQKTNLDNTVQNFGYRWDSAQESYVIPEEPGLV